MSDCEEVDGFVLETKARVHTHNLSCTPENFLLWFCYVAHTDAQLIAAIDAATRTGELLTDTVGQQIFDQFFGRNDQETMIQMTKVVMENLTNVGGAIRNVRSTNEELSRTITDVSEWLGEETDKDTLAKCLVEIQKASRLFVGKIDSLEKELAGSQEKIASLAAEAEELRNDVLVDPLTGLPNRRFFRDVLAQAVSDVECDHEPLSLIVADIDFFKDFNDRWGRPTGDTALKLVASSVRDTIGVLDNSARVGGEEFAMVLRGMDRQEAASVAEALRKKVRGGRLMRKSTGEDLGHLTVSLGVAQYMLGEGPEAFFERAGQLRLKAKQKGCDQVIAA